MPEQAKVVLLEPNPELAAEVSTRLAAAYFSVVRCSTGAEALRAVERLSPDVLVVSNVLPDMPGLDVCREARRLSGAGIIFISDYDDEVETIVGLELGADDALRRPYSPRELVARVKAVLRRTTAAREAPRGGVVEAAGVRLDRERYEVRVDGVPVRLTPIEYRLLSALMAEPGRVVSTEELARAIGVGDDPDERGTVWVHVRRLRCKIEGDPRRPKRLQTVRGEGYRIAVGRMGPDR